MRTAALHLIGSIALIGCVGSVESYPSVGPGTNPNPTGSNSLAEAMFVQSVYPIIHQAGAASDCSECHTAHAPQDNATGFVAATAGDAYATITSYQSVVGNFTPATAGILERIISGDVHVTGRGRSFTDAQRQAITAWLAEDLTERGGHGGTESPTARLLNQWTACMTLVNWQAANMTTAWSSLQTDEGESCTTCHATGGQGMIISNVESSIPDGPPGMWTVVSTRTGFLIQYFSVDLQAPVPQVIVNPTSFQGVSNGTPPHTEHPTFPIPNAATDALSQFYAATAANLANCAAANTKLDPPPT